MSSETSPPPAQRSHSPLRLNRRSAANLTATTALAAWLGRPLNSLAAAAEGDGPAAQPSATDTPPEPGVPAPQPSPLPYLDRIGLQLYTLRDQMAESPEQTLAAVAAAGYWQVELMNIDEQAVQIAAMARAAGLCVHSAFLDYNVITAPGREGVASLEQTLDLAQRIGLRHVVFGYIAKDQRDSAEKCRVIADSANAAADKTRAAGMRMCYHNHSFEFAAFASTATEDAEAKSLTAYDIFIERFDPQQMEFELDVFWAKIAGQDPLALMRRLAGRISQVHLKDMLADTPVSLDESAVPKEAFQELGDGVIDIPSVMRLAKEIGVDQCHVEQDQSPAPLESIVQSYQYLMKAGNP
ncbi:sugar phosphate isomerase/epimerase family protein [Allorhodopirellula heiligendammensis]|uniref:Inosose dehydratase n=1 Tax=Allorhodopirellula heiligendammensis TaxID=2714739 RepID=A0A5C6C560_9BACT|nr:sugar phosphate isomerase/epimerase family protein [Allorhodopirellula heiligendammensis]TWU17939.1 Inosose dehydratase [Allorhodopirellula heiligendammensis]